MLAFGTLPRRSRWGILAVTVGAAVVSTRVAEPPSTPSRARDRGPRRAPTGAHSVGARRGTAWRAPVAWLRHVRPPPRRPSPDPSTPPTSGAVDPEHRLYEPMSIRGPALVVLGIAVFIVVVGVVASALASGSDTTLSIHKITIPDGTSVP